MPDAKALSDLGFLLGRAKLSAEFFEDPGEIEYPGLVPGSSAR
jgi:hypothetical protein